MSPRRRWLVYALLAIVTGGHGYDIATGREHWPFSPYPMYAHNPSEWALHSPRVVGVRTDGGSELPLWESDYLEPFDQSRLLQGLEAVLPQADGRTRVATALVDCLQRYERRRRSGAHDGPPLRALRYYHQSWALALDARNVDHPDRKDLVLEVTLPDAPS